MSLWVSSQSPDLPSLTVGLLTLRSIPGRKVHHFLKPFFTRSAPRLLHLLFQEFIEFRRSVFRHAQALPFVGLEMLGEVNDLTDVISVMRNLTIDRLHHGVILAANRDRAHQIFRPQWLDRVEG